MTASRPVGRGRLITFEGIECSGKGTQIRLLSDWLRDQGIKHHTDHEPGGTPYGEALRVVLKNPELALPAIFQAVRKHSDYQTLNYFHSSLTNYSRSGLVEMYLFMASRSLYAEKIARLIHELGFVVISDRLMDSTTAYQGGGKFQGDPQMLETINFNNRLAMNGLWPDLTFFLDIPVDIMYARMAGENDEKNSFFEKKYNREFYERVRRQYLAIAESEPQRFIVIDGTKTIQEVFEAIKQELSTIIT